jgi:uncharacterized membrane protein
MAPIMRRPQFSLQTLMFLVTVWCLIVAFRAALPAAITCAILFFGAIIFILGPFRIALDAVDRLALRIKGERLD